MNIIRRLSKPLLLLFVVVAMLSCDNRHPQPRPRGFFRIDMPEKEYLTLDTMQHYSFQYPKYSYITNDIHSPNEKDWVNIEFPRFKSTVHISYKPVNNNLEVYLEDSHTLITKHISKAMGIRDSVIINNDKKVYGLMYFIEGESVASPLQFYLTDSTQHFLRGSLYFNIPPNNDSLRPVIDFITDDIRQLVNTLEWK